MYSSNSESWQIRHTISFESSVSVVSIFSEAAAVVVVGAGASVEAGVVEVVGSVEVVVVVVVEVVVVAVPMFFKTVLAVWGVRRMGVEDDVVGAGVGAGLL